MTQTQFPFSLENSSNMSSLTRLVLGVVLISGITLYLINDTMSKDES